MSAPAVSAPAIAGSVVAAPLRPVWPLHRVLQAALTARVYTDGRGWFLDGVPAGEVELRAINTVLDGGLGQAVAGDASVGGRHPGVECDAWLDPTADGKRLLTRWGPLGGGR